MGNCNKLTISRVSLYSKTKSPQCLYTLVVCLSDEKDKIYKLPYSLPPDTVKRTERRISLLLSKIQNKLRAAGCTAV